MPATATATAAGTPPRAASPGPLPSRSMSSASGSTANMPALRSLSTVSSTLDMGLTSPAPWTPAGGPPSRTIIPRSHERMTRAIFPRTGEPVANAAAVHALLYYVDSHPNKLVKIGAYLERRLAKDLNRRNFVYGPPR